MSYAKKFSLFFLPSLFQGVLSFFVLLPLATYILGPREYGIFALITSFTGFGTVIASMGSAYVTAAHYQALDITERKHMVASMTCTGFVLALVFSFITIGIWFLTASTWSIFQKIPFDVLLLSLSSMVLGIPWVFSTDILTLEGDARVFAVVNIAQSLISMVVTLVALYVFHLDFRSLFWGQFGGALIGVAGTVKALWPYRRGELRRRWIGELLRMGSVTVVANIGESIYALLERSFLFLKTGLAQLGLYTHSQQYRTMVMIGLNAIGRTIWPISLTEARETTPIFSKTRQIWDAGYLGVTITGILFATFGKDIIGLLTHGKFSEAHVFVVLWMVFILVQSLGKPHTAFLWASNQGKSYARMHVYALLLGIFSMFFLIPRFGAYGALMALFVQMIFFRILIQIRVRKLRYISSQDRWVIVGSIFILITFGISQLAKLDWGGNLALLIFMYGVLCYFGRHILNNIFVRIRQSL